MSKHLMSSLMSSRFHWMKKTAMLMTELSSSYKRCVKAVLLSHLRLFAALGKQSAYAPLILFTIPFTFFTHLLVHHAPVDSRNQCQTSR